jgi:glycosyltransferase involved in cell wall biosynthesis
MSRLFYVSFWGTSKGWWDRLDLLFDSLSKDFEVYDVGFLHNHAFKIVIEKDNHVNYVRFILRFKKLESKIIINQLFRFPFLIYLVAKFKPVAIIFFSNVIPLYILTIIFKINKLFNFKVILDLDEFGGKEEEERNIINKIYDKITIRFLRFSNLILVLNNFAKNFLKNYGTEDSKIFVLPQFVNPNRFRNNISKEELREKLGLNKDEIIIMTSGIFRAGNYSAMLKFIRAFASLENEFKKNLSLAIIGVAHRKEFISKAIEEGNKVVLKVKYLGPYSKETLNHYLRASDIVLFLSLKNLGSCFNTPIRFSEYLMSGMPILAVDLPNVREYIKDENFLFDINNEGDISNKIKNLINLIRKNKLVFKAKILSELDLKNTYLKLNKKLINIINDKV